MSFGRPALSRGTELEDSLMKMDCAGSPVLGYLVAGVLIGPHTMHIIKNVHGTKAIAEFGVVFLLFNIGLEVRDPADRFKLPKSTGAKQHSSHGWIDLF